MLAERYSWLTGRMGHRSTRAALIYLHAQDHRDRAIADGLDVIVGTAGLSTPHAGSDHGEGHAGGTKRSCTKSKLCLVKAAAPRVLPRHQLAMDQVWDEAVKANPTGLFDGPVVACAGVEWEGTERLVLFWVWVAYRHYALRRVPGAAALPSLFVAVVQPMDDSGLLVGWMSSTAAAGRVQFPGESVEPFLVRTERGPHRQIVAEADAFYTRLRRNPPASPAEA